MKLLFQILVILLMAVTVCICLIQPEMHKAVLVYNSDYTLVPEEVSVIEKEEIPIMEIPAKSLQNAVKVETKVHTLPVTKKTQEAKEGILQQNVKKTETKKVEKTDIPKPVLVQETKKIKSPATANTSQTIVKTFTPEEIAWNVWRSNLQNQIMQDVKLPIIPNGVIFRFSFNVDKYGKITNIYTSSDNPAFTPYAIQYIAPVIRSYQGKSILNFPAGSTRTSTEFKGGWKISSSERLSTPQDYNDYEKVIKTNY